MKQSIEIGNKTFESKKKALLHYKEILNSYDYGDQISDDDFKDVFSLLQTHTKVKEKIGCGIKAIRIAKLKYNTKSFELVRNDNSTEYFSYTKRINSPKNPFTKFSNACREAVIKDIQQIKQEYFDENSKNGKTKCQETGEQCFWEELVIDHRQPNTFSVIVDRFIEINNLDVSEIQYIEIDGGQNKLADLKLKEKFINYHKEKATLRIVKKGMNSSRAYQARIKTQKKDLRIK